MPPKRNVDIVYLLKLWPTHSHNLVVWRASLENVSTGERHGFADLETLLGYLFQQVEAANTSQKETKEGGED